MKMSEKYPLPISAITEAHYESIVDEVYMQSGRLEEEDLIKAINYHDRLVESLRETTSFLLHECHFGQSGWDIIEKVDALLKELEGE